MVLSVSVKCGGVKKMKIYTGIHGNPFVKKLHKLPIDL